MAATRLPRPRDPVQLGKLIGDIATGQAVEDGKEAQAANRGRSVDGLGRSSDR